MHFVKNGQVAGCLSKLQLTLFFTLLTLKQTDIFMQVMQRQCKDEKVFN